MGKFYDPNPAWPVPVRKVLEDGSVDTKYVHSDKELQFHTGDPLDPDPKTRGLGYTTAQIFQEFPKHMSHPDFRFPDTYARDAAHQAQLESKGYSLDHYGNREKRQAEEVEKAAPPSFDPKAQARIDLLEKQLEKQAKQFADLVEAIGSSKKK